MVTDAEPAGTIARALAEPAGVLVRPVARHWRPGGPPAGGERRAHGGADNAGAGELAVGGGDALVGLVGGGDPDPRAAGVGEADEVVGLRPAHERAGDRLTGTVWFPGELAGEAGEAARQRPPPGQRPPGLLPGGVAAAVGAEQRRTGR